MDDLPGDAELKRRMESIMGAGWPDFGDIDRPVEPRMALEGPSGKADGAGRGELTYRQTLRLNALHGFWLRGHMD